MEISLQLLHIYFNILQDKLKFIFSHIIVYEFVVKYLLFFFMSITLINYIVLFNHLIVIIINLLFIYNFNAFISNYFNAILYSCSTQNCMTFYIIKKLFLLFSFNINIFHFLRTYI